MPFNLLAGALHANGVDTLSDWAVTLVLVATLAAQCYLFAKLYRSDPGWVRSDALLEALPGQECGYCGCRPPQRSRHDFHTGADMQQSEWGSVMYSFHASLRLFLACLQFGHDGIMLMQGNVLPNLIISVPSLQPQWATATTLCSGVHHPPSLNVFWIVTKSPITVALLYVGGISTWLCGFTSTAARQALHSYGWTGFLTAWPCWLTEGLLRTDDLIKGAIVHAGYIVSWKRS